MSPKREVRGMNENITSIIFSHVHSWNRKSEESEKYEMERNLFEKDKNFNN